MTVCGRLHKPLVLFTTIGGWFMKAADRRPRNWFRPLQSFKLKSYIYKLPRGTQKVEAMFRKALLRNEK
jgi:hypothetical protein